MTIEEIYASWRTARDERSPSKSFPPEWSGDNPELFSDAGQHREGLVQPVAGVGGGHDGADARLALGNGGESDAGGHHAFLEEGAGEFHGEAAFAHDDGGDGGFAARSVDAADVEPQAAQLLLEEVGVLPEFFDALGLFLQHFEGGDAGGGHRGRMRGGEQERASTV